MLLGDCQIIRPILLLLLLLTLSSCEQEKREIIYSGVECLGESWPAEQQVVFDLGSTTGEGSIVLKVYHEETYKYENVYLKVDIGQQRDTLVSVDLLDDAGYWTGTSSPNGRVVEDTLWFNWDPAKHSKEVKITQYSREELLSGISCIGMTILKKN